MTIILHETPSQYEAEYQRIRAALVLSRTSLNEWLRERGINRQLAYRALKGRSFGRKALALRASILQEVLGQAT
jgi:predicted GNAT family acetyltransferase